MEPVTFRNSSRHLFGTWLTRVPPLVLVVGGLDRYAAILPWWWFEILLAILVLVTIPVLFAPVWAARFRTLTVEGDVLTLRWGWITPETRVTTRDQVTSVQVEEPLSQRLSGVRSVTVLTSGVSSGALLMPALLPRDAVALERLLADAGAVHAAAVDAGSPAASASGEQALGPADAAAPGAGTEVRRPHGGEAGEDGTVLLYRAGVRDIVATSVSGGYVVVMAAAAIGAAQDLGDLFGASTVSWSDPRTWVVAALVLAVAVAVLVAARFRGFRIDRTVDGRLRIAYGAVERTQHTISPGQVVAVTLLRTPVDLLFGTARLVFSTAWLSDGSSSRLVFPSMPRAVAARVVADAVGRPLPELFAQRSLTWALGHVPVVLVAAAVALAARSSGSGGIAVAATTGVVLALALVVTRYLLSALSVTPSRDVVCRTVALSHRVTLHLPGTVTAVIERHLPGTTVGNVTISGWAHRRFVHRVPVLSPDRAAAVRAAIRATGARQDTTTVPPLPVPGGDL